MRRAHPARSTGSDQPEHAAARPCESTATQTPPAQRLAGRSEDKPEVAARVAWSGAGIDLRTDRPRPEAVRKAVRAILDDPRYRARAQALAREYSGYDAVKLATGIIEEEAGRS